MEISKEWRKTFIVAIIVCMAGILSVLAGLSAGYYKSVTAASWRDLFTLLAGFCGLMLVFIIYIDKANQRDAKGKPETKNRKAALLRWIAMFASFFLLQGGYYLYSSQLQFLEAIATTVFAYEAMSFAALCALYEVKR